MRKLLKKSLELGEVSARGWVQEVEGKKPSPKHRSVRRSNKW